MYKRIANYFRRKIKRAYINYYNGHKNNTLEKKLLREGKTRWLDLGCGNRFTEGFYFMDYITEVEIPEQYKDKYFSCNILDLSEEEFKRIGTFDLVRMQHVFEHFTPEEGEKVLENCARLLHKGGYLLITVPDLELFIKYYRRDDFSDSYTFYHWALQRIRKDAPASFFFSIFTHSMPQQQHKWCYDLKGLKYMLGLSDKYTAIKQLKISSELASVPFTHNRPEEDLCVLAQRI